MVALDSLAPGPSSQTTGSAASACLARHQLSATTATEMASTRTTPFTPRRPLTWAASKLTSLPPDTGQCLMAAYSMPGSSVSMPYLMAPLTLTAVSRRLVGLPAIFPWRGSRSAMFFTSGGGSLAAASASCP